MEIEAILSRKTVPELKDIAFRLDLMPPEGKPKKQDWIRLVAPVLREEPIRVRACLSAEQLHQFSAVSLPELMRAPDRVFSKHPLLPEFIRELCRIGLAHSGSTSWELAPEAAKLQNISAKEMRALQAAEKFYYSVRGCTRIFGLIESGRMGQLLLPETPDARTALLEIYSHRRGIKGILRVNGQIWLVDEAVITPKHLFELLQQRQTDEVPWAEYTRSEITQAGVMGIPHIDTVFGRINDWLDELELEPEEILDMLQEAIYAAQRNEVEDYFDTLESYFPEENIPPMFRHAEVEALRQIPIWAYKGHTAKELDSIIAPKLPVPENRGSKCPCGSGKPYRSCCGRFQ